MKEDIVGGRRECSEETDIEELFPRREIYDALLARSSVQNDFALKSPETAFPSLLFRRFQCRLTVCDRDDYYHWPSSTKDTQHLVCTCTLDFAFLDPLIAKPYNMYSRLISVTVDCKPREMKPRPN